MKNGRIFPHEVPEKAPPGYGDHVNRLGRITIPLDDATQLEEIAALIGNFIYVETATSKSASLSIHLNDQYQSEIVFREGMFIAGFKFDTAFVTHAAQAGESLTLVYGIESGNLRIENPAVLSSEITETKLTTVEGVADVTVSNPANEILPADPTRKRAHIFNHHATANIRVGGDGTTSVGRGALLPAGIGITIEGTAAIHGIRTAGVNVDVSITVEKD